MTKYLLTRKQQKLPELPMNQVNRLPTCPFHKPGFENGTSLGSIKIYPLFQDGRNLIYSNSWEKNTHLKTQIPQNCGFHQVNPIQINKSFIPKSSNIHRKPPPSTLPPLPERHPNETSPPSSPVASRWALKPPASEASWSHLKRGSWRLMDLCCERYQEVVGQWVLQHFCVCVDIYVFVDVFTYLLFGYVFI